MVVASSVEVLWSFGNVNKLEDGEIDPPPISENPSMCTKL
jgi:hypothetical protein